MKPAAPPCRRGGVRSSWRPVMTRGSESLRPLTCSSCPSSAPEAGSRKSLRAVQLRFMSIYTDSLNMRQCLFFRFSMTRIMGCFFSKPYTLRLLGPAAAHRLRAGRLEGSPAIFLPVSQSLERKKPRPKARPVRQGGVWPPPIVAPTTSTCPPKVNSV